VDEAVAGNTIVIDAREMRIAEYAEMGSDDIDVPDDRHLQKDNPSIRENGTQKQTRSSSFNRWR